MLILYIWIMGSGLLTTCFLLINLNFSCFEISQYVYGEFPSQIEHLEEATFFITAKHLVHENQAFLHTGKMEVGPLNKEELLNFYSCLYKFPEVDDLDRILITRYCVETENNIGQKIDLIYIEDTSTSEGFYMAYIEGYFFYLDQCDDIYNCSEELFVSPTLDTTLKQHWIVPPSYDIEVTPPVFEAVTEEVLTKEAFTMLEKTEIVFDTLQHQIITKEENVCQDIEVEYDTVVSQYIHREEYVDYDLIPAEFETVTEQMLVKSSYELYKVDTAAYLFDTIWIEECPEINRFVIDTIYSDCVSYRSLDCMDWEIENIDKVENPYLQKDFMDCPDNYVLSGNHCVKRTEIPAIYETRTYEKLAIPSHSVEKIIEAEYQEVSIIKIKIVLPDSCVQTEISDLDYYSIEAPVTINSEVIPATYSTRVYERLGEPSGLIEIPLTGIDTSYHEKELVEGGLSEHTVILCEELWTPTLIHLIKEKLKEKGYESIEVVDSIPDSGFHEAMVIFQEDNGLPIGNISIKLLELLDIEY